MQLNCIVFPIFSVFHNFVLGTELHVFFTFISANCTCMFFFFSSPSVCIWANSATSSHTPYEHETFSFWAHLHLLIHWINWTQKSIVIELSSAGAQFIKFTLYNFLKQLAINPSKTYGNPRRFCPKVTNALRIFCYKQYFFRVICLLNKLTNKDTKSGLAGNQVRLTGKSQ